MSASPLHDIFEVQGILPAGQKPVLSDLMDEEEKKDMLRYLANTGQSGLSLVADTIDTPGAWVRGFLAGDPVSDKRYTGRDVLRKWGLAGPKDNWLNFTGGLLLEMATDPLTYATLGLSSLAKGSLTQAGKAAKAAGLLRNEALDSVQAVNKLRRAKGIAAHADDIPRVREYRRLATAEDALNNITDPVRRAEAEKILDANFRRFGVDPAAGRKSAIGALDNVRIPGTNIGFEVSGGKLGDAVAQGLDRLGNWTKTAPGIGHVTRTAAALFDKNVGGMANVSNDLGMTNELQLASRQRAADLTSRQEDVLRSMALLQGAAGKAVVPDVINGVAIPAEFRTINSPALHNAIADYARSGQTSGNTIADLVLENVPELKALRDSYVQLAPETQLAAKSAGLPVPSFKQRGEARFFPRQLHWFDQAKPPQIGGKDFVRDAKKWGRDERAFGLRDNFGRQRDEAYDIAGGAQAFRALTGGGIQGIDPAAIRNALATADQAGSRQIIDQALEALFKHDPQKFGVNGDWRPFQWVESQEVAARLKKLRASPKYQAASPARQAALDAKITSKAQKAASGRIQGNYDRLAAILKTADQQFAEKGIGIFDSNPFENALRYRMGQAENLANAKQLTELLGKHAENIPASAVPGQLNISLLDAAERLGFDRRNFAKMWKNGDPKALSINAQMVDRLKQTVPVARFDEPTQGLLGAYDQWLSAFKGGALATPGFHMRNLFSGSAAAATSGSFNPLDMWAALQASRGNPEMLGKRLLAAKDSPYAHLGSPEEAARAFLADSAAGKITASNSVDDIAGQTAKSLVPQQNQFLPAIAEAFYKPGRSWGEFGKNFFSMRGVGSRVGKENTNPYLVLMDKTGKAVEDSLRMGQMLTATRKGMAPMAAADEVLRSQLNYAPESFTDFERQYMRRLFPFYSFMRRATPSVAEELINRPGGLYGQMIRGINTAGKPSEDNFVPEDMRRKTSIPLPEAFGGQPRPGIQRYINKLEPMFEAPLNLLTKGTGGTVPAMLADTVAQTGSNILGMSTPAIKALVEWATNKQLHTGKDLTDAWSVLERDVGPWGRPLQHAISSLVPGGSHAVGVYTNLTDDRLSPADRVGKLLINKASGFGIKDVDTERERERAAREVLTKMLRTTPGSKTYESINVPEDALMKLGMDEKKLYLLYRIIQSEAAKRARDKKKQEQAMSAVDLLSAVRG